MSTSIPDLFYFPRAPVSFRPSSRQTPSAGGKIVASLIKLEAREARRLGLDMPTKLAVTEPEGNGIPLEAIRLVMDRLDRANEETVDVTPEPTPLLPATRG